MHITSVNETYYSEFFQSTNGGNSGSAPIAPQDIVSINSDIANMSDEEVEELLQNTIQVIGEDSVNALSVHTLNPQRVYSLLAE
ncbi:MAG: hypothetical protein IJU76_07840 [Desulfovibrionaceae bacterium]|nr:hypothetical protein [Desulfovibrionaceae bacterium]